ncbi:MAG: 2-amino-4-hydroxy-6-hydroxymethyldihydropteridine diphosphokinase [Candidatus Glassbacteria bacterium]|nr:2-amino-4-hydroxy-6-hydroxymethyldihydropteridine diphosphokinase [Candidatus Glassbacteria bacterium]
MERNVYISLGTNLGKLEENLQRVSAAVAALDAVRVTGCSEPVLTRPVGLKEQPDFLNQVQRLETSLSPEKLLVRLQRIEDEMGRVRERRWGPRIIDLDLLFYGNKVRNTKRLVLPHPQVWKRRFFLEMVEQIDSTFLQQWARQYASRSID